MESKPVRIYTDGIFDCFHFGHARLLKQIKEMFPNVYLIVGICNDQVTWKEKGRTIMYDYERYESVRHCKWVDEVFENAPWFPTVEFLDKIEAKYLAHDPEPYKYGDIEDVYKDIKTQGKFLPTKRTEGISTTDIMLRLIRNYNDYVERIIKKGAKPNDLNIKHSLYFVFKIKIIIEKILNRMKKNDILLVKYFIKWRNY